MSDSALWSEIREQCEGLQPGTALVTPLSDRQFAIVAVEDDVIVVQFRDGDDERSLRREQFEVLADRLGDGRVSVSELPPGVEPYATVLSLTPSYVADGDAIYRAPEDTDAGESPYLVSPAEARTAPERVHDDALLLADLLDRSDASDPDTLDTDSLTDLYVLLSDVQRGSGRLRQSASEPLLDRLGPDQSLHGRYGTVHRTTRERRRPKDDETVLDALDEHSIPREWVLGIDPDKLDVVLAVTDLTEQEVYDVDEQVYVQKTGVDENEKYSRLQGLSDRIENVDGIEGETLREELDALEERIDRALSAG